MSNLNQNKLSKLDQLKSMTTVVADTGELEAIAKYQPIDATTNPSLLLKAAALPQYKNHFEDAVNYAKNFSENKLSHALEKLSVNIGCEILKIIPGRISTEVDARESFNTQESVNIARRLINLYEQAGINKNRVLIKIASTWEGIKACEILEREGIHCNMTLMFDFCQAVACAEAQATLISPFVGRIYDWFKNHEKREFTQSDDPGVLSVKKIYEYFRFFDIKTVVMGASFRNLGQIQGLAGCDFLTISPNLLAELAQDFGDLPQVLSIQESKKKIQEKISLSESQFRFLLNENAMATEKLAEGIRLFCKDIRSLERMLAQSMGAF